MPRLFLAALLLLGALANHPAEAVQRAFVASSGSDANAATTGCSLAGPCRSFTAAMGVVDPGGEIVALDAAGYGAVTITKSVTITANPGFFAGISATTGNAITIATAGVNVILRGLNLNGVGADNGIEMTDGNRLSIENCVISNFPQAGILVSTAATVRVVDSTIRESNAGVVVQNGATGTISRSRLLGNFGGVVVIGGDAGTTTSAAVSESLLVSGVLGIYVFADTAGASARASVTRSSIVNNVAGVEANGSAGNTTITLSRNLITGNQVGIEQTDGTGVTLVRSLGDNTVDQNEENTSGTITPISGM